MVKAAAGNRVNGTQVMTLLLDRRGEITITEEVLKAAAGNENNGEQVMTLLLGPGWRHRHYGSGGKGSGNVWPERCP